MNSVYQFLHSSDYVMLASGLILLFAMISQYLSWKFKLPSILFLILSGILLGPVSAMLLPGGMKLVDGQIILGQALFPFISICVAIILFEGSLSLDIKKLKSVGKSVFLLLTVGIALTVIFTAAFCYYVLGFSKELSLLIGGITCVSGPTVVPPLMRAVRPKKHIAKILKWESIVVDPIGALIVVFIMSWYFAWGSDTSNFVFYIFLVCILGIVSGLIFGYLIGLCIRRQYIPEYLKSFFVLSVIVVGFILVDSVMHGAGLLMVTVAGIAIANMEEVRIADIVSFKENLSIVIISVLFIILSADIDFSLMEEYWLSLIEIFLFLQFVLRPAVVYICSIGSKNITMAERFIMGMVYPRGIVAASVAALVAFKLVSINADLHAEANTLVFFVFMIIVLTVIFQSLFVPPISRMLKVSEPEGKGFLIIGGNVFAREVAVALAKKDVDIVITDSSWANIQKCRQLGLNTYYGSPVSVHADWNINLDGIGSMLGLSTSEYINAISAVKYSHEFGADNVYVIRATQTESYKGIGSMGANLAMPLFEEHMDHNFFTEKMNNGYEIGSTRITENYTLDRFVEANPTAVLLFKIDDSGTVMPYKKDLRLRQNGYTLITLRHK